MFSSLLIANRGEIAVRIIATARTLGVRTIAVFSEADADAMHVRLADEAVCIGSASAASSYLNGNAIVAAALETGAEAVHPGYGFLSENAGFAQAVRDAGLIFVGPGGDAIATMSDKVAARAAAVAAGVPVLPGSAGAVQSSEDARRVAAEIGYPVAVKASFGGGGRGIRVAESEEELDAAMAAASREAGAAFGRSEIFLEKFLARPRHVEVQILADQHGRVIHLGDRDCSVQRRHQKMIEEAPAPCLPDEVRHTMLTAAVSLGRAVGYVGAGTVEFLYDPAGDQVAFLEMNTRLQVEHGVTEMITGIDLVAAQLRTAAGEPLDLAQDDLRFTGHAIQARVAAEDSADDFRPAPGEVRKLRLPQLPWTRADFGVEAGDRVQPHYDSMIGKLLAWGPTREDAAARLHQTLRQLEVVGVPTTAPYAAAILREADFIGMTHHTRSVEEDWSIAVAPDIHPPTADTEEGVTGPQLTERQVRLPGAGNRIVRVYGCPAAATPGTVPSRRANRTAETQGIRSGQGGGSIASPMDGVVVQLPVAVGDRVEAGKAVLILEAMKMEVTIPSPRPGVVTAIACGVGDSVAKGQALVEIAAD